jgi:chromosome segregation protein
MVADLPTAFRVAESSPGTNFLTLSGEAYSPRGTLSAVGERKAMAGFLAVKREKRELEVKLESLRRKLYVAREQVTKRKEEQAAVQELLKKLVAESRRLEVEAVGFHHAIGRVEAEIQKIDQSESVAAAELTQLSGERQVEETKLKDAASGIAGIESETRSGEEELRDLAVRLESLRGENLALSRRLAALASTQAVRQERRSSHEADLRRLSGEHEEVARRFESNRQEKESALARIAALDTDGQEAEAKIEKLARDIESEESTHSELQKRFVEQREGLSKAEERLRILHGERESAMDARGRIEIEKTRLENDLEHLARDCQEEFHLPLLDVASQIPEGDWQRDYEEVCGEHDELRKRLETFGAINMRALEEYQELDERYQFQSKQRADIEKSIADTQKAIAEINRRSVEQFQEAFNRIRENFIEVFQLLFKGGECDIRLLDDADVLESGIDIIAQPPGKRLQNVLLLSGGEKALTALALLIAIFRYRPSPFCVLDEVDAPLDDANVGRFTQLIIELSKETQFILITHNKRTMEIARTLYGVTMEEPGVSKIVSVDLRSPQQVEKNMESHGGA